MSVRTPSTSSIDTSRLMVSGCVDSPQWWRASLTPSPKSGKPYHISPGAYSLIKIGNASGVKCSGVRSGENHITTLRCTTSGKASSVTRSGVQAPTEITSDAAR